MIWCVWSMNRIYVIKYVYPYDILGITFHIYIPWYPSWLVVEPPLWKIEKSIMMMIRNIWNRMNMFQTTNQQGIFRVLPLSTNEENTMELSENHTHNLNTNFQRNIFFIPIWWVYAAKTHFFQTHIFLCWRGILGNGALNIVLNHWVLMTLRWW